LAAVTAAALVDALAAAVPEVVSLGPPIQGKEAAGPVVRVKRDAGAVAAARARLVAAAKGGGE
jgi:hypothetical protein